MNKIIKIIFITSIAVFGVGFLSIPSVQAVEPPPLFVEFEDTPLFNEANFLPGENVIRWVKVTNNSGETQPIITEAINYPGFPDPNNVPVDDLSRALNIIIREKGGSDLFGGSTGKKTLFSFYQNGETYLSDISAGNFKEYEFKITFPAEKGNDWQDKTTYFDVLIGFQGTEGSDGGNGNGGGGILPGLTILDESSVSFDTTSVTITWTTNYLATSWVIYALEGETYSLDLNEPNYGYPHSSPEDLNKVTSHSVEITGLSPGSTYYYRCVSHASLAVGMEHSFTTLGTKVTEEEKIEGEVGEEEEEEEEEEGDTGNSFSYEEKEGEEGEEKTSEVKGEEIVAEEEEEKKGEKEVQKEVLGKDLASKGFLAAITGMPLSWKILYIIAGIVILGLIILWFVKKRKKSKA